MEILQTEGLKKHYHMGQSLVRALDGVSLSVNEGEFLGLLGTSGSGKSTLLNLIAGLDRPTEGILHVLGRDMAGLSREELSLHRRVNVGMIFQSFHLISTMSAAENIELAMMFADKPRADRENRARLLLASVGLVDRRLHKPKELSGGEQQRVAIARALANDPRILLADEPTGNLDSHTAREIMGELARLNRDGGKTVILVTHDQTLAAPYVSRTVILSDGRIMEGSLS